MKQGTWTVLPLGLALCCPGALSAQQPSARQRVAGLRSVTYYKFGTKLADTDIGLLERDIAHAREIGFNGMWLALTWRSLSPVALPQPVLNDAAWQKLDAIINTLTEKGFTIIIPLGHFGRGWAPEGFEEERLAEWMVDDTAWDAFEDHVVRLTGRYADRSNILWMFYTESFQGPMGAPTGARLGGRTISGGRVRCFALATAG